MTGMFGIKTVPKWRKDLAKANKSIEKTLKAEAERPYVPSKVFITFETEAAQRRCLASLDHGTLAAAFDFAKGDMHSHHVFKENNVLAVSEAVEPTEVFWKDVQVTFFLRARQQAWTFLVAFLLVCGSVKGCTLLEERIGPSGDALWISFTDITVPTILRELCFAFETHVTFKEQQLSLFLKLSFFRWLNSAIVLFLITDVQDFLTPGTLAQIKAILIADAVTTPLMRTFDPSEYVKRMWVSRYSRTQEKMNSFFYGVIWYPAERYADLTKTLFIALFYSALFPAGLFLTSLSYSMCYVVDKYSLLRTWRTSAEIGDTIMRISRGHMAFAVFFHAVMSMVFFAQFPFDNVCRDREAGSLGPEQFAHAASVHNVTTDLIYHHCDQSFTSRIAAAFRDPDATASGEGKGSVVGKQRRIVRAQFTLVAVLTLLYCFLVVGRMLLRMYRPFHQFQLKRAHPNEDEFTSVDDIQAYIPIIAHPGLEFPLIAADVSTFETKYLPFTLPKEELYSAHSLFNEHELPGFSPKEMRHLFSEVHYFPPPNVGQERVQGGHRYHGVPQSHLGLEYLVEEVEGADGIEDFAFSFFDT